MVVPRHSGARRSTAARCRSLRWPSPRSAGALFPFGLMRRKFVPLVVERYKSADTQLLDDARGADRDGHLLAQLLPRPVRFTSA